MYGTTLRPIAGMLTLLIFLPIVGGAQSATPSEESALQAYRAGEIDRAVDLYTKALSETDDPNHRARLQVQIAWNLFFLGRSDEVKTHLRAALVEDPNLALDDAYYNQEFLDHFERARRLNFESAASGAAPPPDLEATIAGISDRIRQKSDLEGALVDADRLIESYPRDGRLIPLKVEVLRQLGRTDEAQSLSLSHGGAVTASENFEDSFSVPDLILRANRLLEEGDSTTALQLVRQAVNRQPNNSYALELMAEAAMQTADWQSAEYALKSALSLQPDNIGLKLRLGEVYLATYEASAARDIFKSLTELYPTSDRAWASLGLLEARLQNNERALDALGKALAENPMLPAVQLANGELLLLDGDYEAALVSFEAAQKLMPDDPQLEARHGQALLAAGRHGQALVHLRTAVESGFDAPDVQRSLALALALNEMYAESRRVLDATEEDSAGDHEVVTGYLDLQRGQYEEAEATFKSVANARSSDPASVNLLAASIYPQARFEEAVILLKLSHELDPLLANINSNLEKARAARAAEILAENARPVKALPK
jgi:tetratricopeptide (TPR) repeat protein